MTKTITGSYDASLKIRNAKDDLIASGIDQEKFSPMRSTGNSRSWCHRISSGRSSRS